MEKKKLVLSVVPMRTEYVFPNTAASFEVGRGLSIAAIEEADKHERYIFLPKQRECDTEYPTAEDLSPVGTIAEIRQATRLPIDQMRVYVMGISRARVLSYFVQDGVLFAELERVEIESTDPKTEEAYYRLVRELVDKIVEHNPKNKEFERARLTADSPDAFINVCARYINFKDEIKSELLLETNLCERLKKLAKRLQEEIEIAELSQKISEDVRKSVDKSQKEYYLREQLKAIHKQLGDDVEESEELREKLLAKNLPEAIAEKALHELDRMDKMPPSSPEYTVLRNYLDWIIDLPWNEETTDTENLSDVEAVLNADHYGLEKIKERVVEYLAVLKLTGELKAPILCLYGPPGVGKTSIAKSIARALQRKFVRMSLGGVKDEAEVRGHRRTYIGAMPGRIIYEIKTAGASNPVFLLDEIDKLSSDMRGDPASALLEVLDPEQNSTFRDRYLEVPYDLSRVLFIATANYLETIPAPLRDRMEIVELSGYTPQEKTEIAKHYLVPKKCKENGLPEDALSISDDAIDAMIEGYTRESGVRSLERTIGAVCRKIAVRLAKGELDGKVSVTKKNLDTFLGAKRFSLEDEMLEKDEIGTATGLAWTAVGGTTLTIEVSVMEGKGNLLLTGQLGDVMQESAKAAFTYLKANADRYGIDPKDFETKDIHIHIPEGATPKDGPSAGITLATALLSALTKRPVRRDIAMTGEITLRGKVLPIGGLKEKSLAASRIGIRDIIIPKDNKKDIEEIPETIRKTLRFIPVSDVDEVFREAVRGLK